MSRFILCEESANVYSCKIKQVQLSTRTLQGKCTVDVCPFLIADISFSGKLRRPVLKITLKENSSWRKITARSLYTTLIKIIIFYFDYQFELDYQWELTIAV